MNLLEKNEKTRKVYQRLLRLQDRFFGKPFPRMKRVKQITNNHCGPAVIQELFSFLGKSVSQTSVVRSIKGETKIKKYGLNILDLAKATRILGKHEFVFWRKHKATIGDILKILNKYHYPVGVEWQGVFYEDEDEDNGHYAVVTSIDKSTGYLRLHDTYMDFAGIDRRFSIKLFLKRWWDINHVKGRNIYDKRTMFVITPKQESWPKEIGMIKI